MFCGDLEPWQHWTTIHFRLTARMLDKLINFDCLTPLSLVRIKLFIVTVVRVHTGSGFRFGLDFAEGMFFGPKAGD